jgi:GNAT superfamily N-acetyltransferase
MQTNDMEKIRLFKRPGGRNKLVRQVLEIVRPLTGSWFTKEVAESLPNDLHFHDLAALFLNGAMQSFITFTGMDGAVLVALMATAYDSRGRGYGTRLYQWSESYVRRIGFNRIRLQTVPADVNPNYRSTISFYEKQGFVFVKRYDGLWEHGAVEYEKKLIL